MTVKVRRSTLKRKYSWKATKGDDATLTRRDSGLFSRREGYEVVPMIQSVADHFGYTKKQEINRIEDAIANELPGNLRGRKKVRAWLLDHLEGPAKMATGAAGTGVAATGVAAAAEAQAPASPTGTGAAEGTMLPNTGKLVAEALLVPGTSLLLAGDVRNGLLHVAGGFASTALLGPLGCLAWVVLKVNSYAKATTGQHLPSALGLRRK